jgi:hypothetical protein
MASEKRPSRSTIWIAGSRTGSSREETSAGKLAHPPSAAKCHTEENCPRVTKRVLEPVEPGVAYERLDQRVQP